MAGKGCLDLVGDEPEAKDLFEGLRDIAELAEQSGISRETLRPVRLGLEACRQSDFKASLASLRGAVAAAGQGAPTANALASGATKAVQDLVNLVAAAEALLQTSEEHVRGEGPSADSRSASVRAEIARDLEAGAGELS